MYETTCYHGTVKSKYIKIEKEGFKISKGKKHWLGDGVYFFKYSKDAESWAEMVSKDNDSPLVITAEIKVEEYMDLDNPEELNKLKRFKETTKNKIKEAIISGETEESLMFEDEKAGDAFIFNLYKRSKDIDMIKYTFNNNRTRNFYSFNKKDLQCDIRAMSKINYNEVQLCLTNPNDVTKIKELKR